MPILQKPPKPFVNRLPVTHVPGSNNNMLRYITRKLLYGLLVMLGVVVVVFFLFQGFGDPSRLIMGQRADASTQENIRKELYLDKPRWKQFLFYLNDVSPLS